MVRFWRKVLFLTGVLVLSVTVLAFGQTALKPAPGGEVKKDGDYVTWMSFLDDNWDVYYLNLDTGTTGNLTDHPAHQAYPDVWSDYVVWQDNRNHADDPSGVYAIYLYNFQTGETKQVSQTEGNHQHPIIAENNIVWTNHKDGRTDIVLYDLETNSQKTIYQGTTAFGVKFDGQIIAWTDFRNGDADIYAYDLIEQEEIRLTYSDKDEMSPLVGGGTVVWTEEHNNTNQIYSYNPDDDIYRRVTAGDEDHQPIAFDGEKLLLEEDGKLFLNQNPTVSVQQPVGLKTGSANQIILENGQVTYITGSNLDQEPVSDALERKETPEDGADDHSDTSGSLKSQDQQTPSVIKLESPDNKLSLTIGKNRLSSNFAMQIKETNNPTGGMYTTIGPQYQFEVVAGAIEPSTAINVTLNYSLNNIHTDMQKIGLYQRNTEGAWVYIPMTHNVEEKTIKAEINSLAPIALMSYQQTFNDLNGHWGQDAIEVVAAHKAINGYPNGGFAPNKPITRAEFTKLLVTIMGVEVVGNQAGNFQDVSKKHWAYLFIETAAQRGWVKGYNNKFSPAASISREEMVTMLMRAADSESEITDKLAQYKDHNQISQWAKPYFARAVEQDLISGYNKLLDPHGATTRAEAAALFYRYLDMTGRF